MPACRSWLRRGIALAAVSVLILGASASVSARDEPGSPQPGSTQPGRGVAVQPVQSSVAEEAFQTLLVCRGLAELGYSVAPIETLDYGPAHMAIAKGDATFMAAAWDPMHVELYESAGGDDKLSRRGVYSPSAIQGYLIDKKTAEAHGITRVEQLQDAKLAALFDTDGDGRADLAGCNPEWSCARVIEHHLDAYGLRERVAHRQGGYPALIDETISRFEAGKPVLYYTWTPYWVSAVLRPGRDVIWLQVPFSALPGTRKGFDTTLSDGSNYGFQLNKQRIVVNKVWAEANPAGAKLMEVMRLPARDISAQNLLMRRGEKAPADIERHVDAWIEANRAAFDRWLGHARAAARRR